MDLFMPFGCKAVVMIPVDARQGHKTHTQVVGWAGIFVGYGAATGHGGAYRIYNPKDRKVHEVSYNLVTCVEDVFPWKGAKDDDAPLSFEPTIDSFADEAEWEKFDLSPDEEAITIRHLAAEDPDHWESLFEEEQKPIDPTENEPLPEPQISADFNLVDEGEDSLPSLEPETPALVTKLSTDREKEPGTDLIVEEIKHPTNTCNQHPH